MADDFHCSHCDHCFSTSCSFTSCSIFECDLCYAPMHQCKQDDHREICRVEMVPCLNSSFGCPLTIRRSFLSHHLAICPASVVSCSHERSRAALDENSTKKLKSIGKRRQEKAYECSSSSAKLPIDEALALFDQKLILDGYTYSRRDRTRRRDGIHLREALLPVRPIFEGGLAEGIKANEAAPRQDEDVDSSEDERMPEQAIYREFYGHSANCYQCQLDATLQHCESLDRARAEVELLLWKRNRRSYYTVDNFYAERNLLISLHVVKLCEIASRSETLLKDPSYHGGALYTRRCMCVVPRRELESHHNSQHVKGGDVDLESLIVRCPLWWKGCQFHTSRIQPKNGGEIRFIQELSAFTHKPAVEFESPILDDSCPIVEAPGWALGLVARFLSDVALSALALTCRNIRNTLFSSLALDRGVVSLRWTKKDRCRWTSQPAWSFPLTERPIDFCTRPCTNLSEHISMCPFNEPCPVPGFVDPEETVPVPGSMRCVPKPIGEAI
ncbi:hypothetical protein PENTCL1PPCAC_19114, partial [Pristionchus entomophagus]